MKNFIIMAIIAALVIFSSFGSLALAADGCCGKAQCKCASGTCCIKGACQCGSGTCCVKGECKCGTISCGKDCKCAAK